MNNEELSVLWREYKENNSPEARDKLILIYVSLVKYVAGRMGTGLPQNIETADLISYGVFGLIDAIEKFDPSRQIKFETYAISRIKGSIIDELRALDWVPRSLRHRAKEIEQIYVSLENKLKREPSDKEVAGELGVTVEDYNEMLSKLSYTSVIALEELWIVGGEKGDRVSLIDSLEDTKSGDPSVTFELEEMKQILANAIDRLSEREKIVVALYYYEGLTLKEIGEVLGVTESRVSQLHTKAIFRLRGRLLDAKKSLV